MTTQDIARNCLEILKRWESRGSYVHDADLFRLPIGEARALCNAVLAQQWISVDERLPDEGQPVLFIVNSGDDLYDGRMLGGVFRTIAGMPGFSTPGVTYGASHWMPSPPLPADSKGAE